MGWVHIDDLAYRADQLHALLYTATRTLEELDLRRIDTGAVDRTCRLMNIGLNMRAPMGTQIDALPLSPQKTVTYEFAIGELVAKARELPTAQLERAARVLIGMVRDSGDWLALQDTAKWLKKVIRKCQNERSP